MRRSGTAPVDSCSWWTRDAPRGRRASLPAGVGAGACRSRPRRSRRRRRGRTSRSRARPRGARAARPTAPSRPRASSVAAALHGRAGGGGTARRPARSRGVGKRQADGCCAPSGRRSRAPGGARAPGGRSSASCSAAVAPGRSSESSLSSSAVAPARAPQQRGVVLALAAALLVDDDLVGVGVVARRAGRAVARGVVEHEHLGRERQRARARRRSASRQRTSSSRCSVLTTQKESSTSARYRRRRPTASTRARCASTSSTPRRTRRPTTMRCARALAAAGADVTLVTSALPYGEVPPARRLPASTSASTAARPARRAARCAGSRASPPTSPTCSPTAARAAAADVVHFQWLTVAAARRAPAARGGRSSSPPTTSCRASRGPASAPRRRGCYGRVDAVVVHSEHGRARLVGEVGVDPAPRRGHPARRARPPHARRSPTPLPAELAAVEVPVVLCFGLHAPVQGPRRARRRRGEGIADAELWVVGAPRMDTAALRAAAPPGVRFVERFVDGGEAAAFFRRADLAVLPYREIEQSGVLVTALAFGAAARADRRRRLPRGRRDRRRASSSPPGDPGALHAGARRGSLGDPARRRALAARRRPRRPARPYAWGPIARASPRALRQDGWADARRSSSACAAAARLRPGGLRRCC